MFRKSFYIHNFDLHQLSPTIDARRFLSRQRLSIRFGSYAHTRLRPSRMVHVPVLPADEVVIEVNFLPHAESSIHVLWPIRRPVVIVILRGGFGLIVSIAILGQLDKHELCGNLYTRAELHNIRPSLLYCGVYSFTWLLGVC